MHQPPSVQPPGVTIDHLPAATETYLGSPSIAVLTDGSYVASLDLFGPTFSEHPTTKVFRSVDSGETWTHRTTITGSFWSNLFVHRQELYLMGCTGRYGAMSIRKSVDGGTTWTAPTDEYNGLLRNDGMYHTAPVPVVEHGGRLWRAMEDMHPSIDWAANFRALVVSADADADLLRADSWRETPPVQSRRSWLGGHFGGWLEGNAVVAPDGHIVDVLRVDYRDPTDERAAIVRISDDGTSASFDPTDTVRFPG